MSWIFHLFERISEKLVIWAVILFFIGSIAVVYFFFKEYALLLFITVSAGFMVHILLTEGKDKYVELKEYVQQTELTLPTHLKKLCMVRQSRRILIDLFITIVVSSGMILYAFINPLDKLELGRNPVIIALISIFLFNFTISIMIRTITFFTTSVYVDQERGVLLIISRLKSKEIPLADLRDMQIDSSPDLLRLHPLFVLFTSHVDYTVNMGAVLRLSFPGETLYFTIEDIDYWIEQINTYRKTTDSNLIKENKTLPLWHPQNIKRLIGKGYFAFTVKGISAYVGLLLLLYALGTPPWLMVISFLTFWMFNIYISDRVLATAMDVKPISEGKVYDVAQHIFARLNIQKVRLFVTENPVHNAMATGMNVGRSMITLTSATLKLPLSVIEGILAHEAVHVKKRDVLIGQLLRMGYMLCLILFVLVFEEPIVAFIENVEWLAVLIIMVLMWALPIYLTVVYQWMEVRADHLGSQYLSGQQQQMAHALKVLTEKELEDTDQSITYSQTKKKREEEGSENPLSQSAIDRPEWLWRIIEFNLQMHPPMYWRIKSLKDNHDGWGVAIWKRWVIDRVKDSLPDRSK